MHSIPKIRPNEILTSDFKNAPYWWDAAPPTALPMPRLEPTCDVAMVGTGYTALCAALTLLKAGRNVFIFDSEKPGFGAARRNAGFLGRVLKKSYGELVASKGKDHALRVYQELNAAYQSTLQLIASQSINCYANRCGRFIGATSEAHFDELEQDLALMKNELGFEYEMLSKAEQHREMASDHYVGGAIIPDLGSLHPGLYHKGLLERVLNNGGIVVGNTAVQKITRTGSTRGFLVQTSAGEIEAHDVLVATNGYTPRDFTWHSRRLVPFTGYMAATELLPSEMLDSLIPKRRTIIDSNVNIDFFRPAPDAPRLLFGGATGSGLTNSEDIAIRLHGILTRVFPQLQGVKLSHVWTGQCAGTFDMMPHIGGHDGVWYGMGYNFAGVPMGSYFGTKIAHKILGNAEGKTVFDEQAFPTVPFYSGNPWFVPLAMRYFDWRDRVRASKNSDTKRNTLPAA